MVGVEWLMSQVVPVMLVAARLLGLFVASPLLSSLMIPIPTKALLGFALSLALFPIIEQQMMVPASIGVFELGIMVFAEVLIGYTLGLLANLPLLAVQIAGFAMGYQMGLSIARSYNPELEIDGDLISQLLYMMALGVFIAMGGVEVLFIVLAGTFERVPVGGMGVSMMPLDLLTALLTSAFELGMRIAAPVQASIFLILVSMGFIMKTMPQINVMSIGFALKIMIGVAMRATGLALIDGVMAVEVEDLFNDVIAWGMTLGGDA